MTYDLVGAASGTPESAGLGLCLNSSIAFVCIGLVNNNVCFRYITTYQEALSLPHLGHSNPEQFTGKEVLFCEQWL